MKALLHRSPLVALCLVALVGSIVLGAQVGDPAARLEKQAWAPGSLGSLVNPADRLVAPQVLGGDAVPDLLVGPGNGPNLTLAFSGADGSVLASGYPFGPGWSTGVRLAAGDISGDGIADIIAGQGPDGSQVRVFNGADATLYLSGYPYGPTFAGGVFVAAGDVNGDGRLDVITGQGQGGGRVRIFSGADAADLGSVSPFGPDFTGGVHVAAGDVDGDGRAEVIAGQAAGGLVAVLRGTDLSPLIIGPPYTPGYAGGVHVAAGDLTGDGRAEVIVGPGSGGEPVRVFDALTATMLASFVPYTLAYPGGVRVAVADLTGDGRGELLTAPGPGGPPLVRVFNGNGSSELASFYAYDLAWRGGIYLAAPAAAVLRFTSAATTTFTTGQANTFTITTAGAPPGTAITLTGALPPDVTFTDHGNGTATLAGTPPAGSVGTYALTFSATKGVGAPITQDFTLKVEGPAAFTSAATATFPIAAASTFTVTTTGFPAPTITHTGALPAGVTFADQGDGTATLAGTPGPGTGGAYPLTLTASNTIGPAATQAFTLTVSAVNQPPRFTEGPNQTVAEDAGAQILTGWATDISAGPPNESGQTVTFEVSANTNPSLFSGPPAVSPTGTLTYTAAPDASGSAEITIVLRDSGGTDNGGVNTSAPRTFTITVTSANDAPSFTAGASHLSAEDAGPQSVATWATAISAGPADEAGQTLTFIVTANTNAALFSGPPAVSPTGALTYTAAPNGFGSADITIVLRDNGGTANSGVETSAPQTFRITVTAINDPPVIVADSYTLEEGGTASLVAPGVMANDLDPDTPAASLVATLVAGPAHALFFRLNTDGSFTYVHDGSETSADSFTYRIGDGTTDSSVTTVTLTVTSVDDLLETEPNNSAETANGLTGSVMEITGNIYLGGDVDYYSFAAQAGDRVYAATMTSSSSNASVDSVLALFASDGTTVLESDSDDGVFGATSSSIAGATIPVSGTYYLRVTHNSATNQLRPYDLWVRVRSGAPAAETEPNDAIPGQPLPASGWVSGALSSATDADYFAVTLNAGDSVAASLDLDPERDNVEWNGQLGLGLFGDPAIILPVNDAGTRHAGLRGTLRDREGRGDVLRCRQRAVDDVRNLSPQRQHPDRGDAAGHDLHQHRCSSEHPDRTRGGHLDPHHPGRCPDRSTEGGRRPDPQLHGGPGRHADGAGRQHRGAVHRRRLHFGWPADADEHDAGRQRRTSDWSVHPGRRYGLQAGIANPPGMVQGPAGAGDLDPDHPGRRHGGRGNVERLEPDRRRRGGAAGRNAAGDLQYRFRVQ